MDVRRCAGLMATSFLRTAVALGQTSTDEAARSDLIQQAERAAAASDHVQALDLAGRAGRIRLTPSLQLLIAREHQALGHTLDALTQGRACTASAEADATLRNRAQILDACRAVVTATESHVGRLRVIVPDPAPEGLEVRIAGNPVNSALLGVAVPLMPGDIAVSATAPRCQPYLGHATVSQGAEATLRVTLDPAPVATQTPPPTASVPAVAPTPAPVTQAATPVALSELVRVNDGPSTAQWGLGLTGVGLLVASGVFLAVASDAIGTRNGIGDPTDPDYVAADQRASTFLLFTYVSLGVGVAAVGTAVTWFALDRPHHLARVEGRIFPWLMPAAGGLHLGVGGTL